MVPTIRSSAILSGIAILLVVPGRNDLYAQWVSQSSGTNQSLHDVCFVDSSCGWAVGDSGVIIHTVDAGKTWSPQASGKTIPLRSVSFCDRTTGWVVGDLATALRTTDGGTTWNQVVVDTLPDVRCLKVQTLSQIDCVILRDRFFDDYWAGSRIYATTDAGGSWSDVSPILSGYRYIPDVFFLSRDKGFACGFGGTSLDALQIHRTNNAGASWDTYNFDAPTYGQVHRIFFSDSARGWAAADSLYHSTDAGANWTCVGKLPFGYATGLVMFEDTGWGNSWFGNIYHTTNGGSSWIAQTQYPYNVETIFFISTKLGWAVGYQGLVLHTTNGGITSVAQTYSDVRVPSFELYQNYPNPFNPSTVISFVTFQRGFATIRFYDALGREIEGLFAKEVAPGLHSFAWQPGPMASGNYFYRLDINGYHSVKKLTLVR